MSSLVLFAVIVFAGLILIGAAIYANNNYTKQPAGSGVQVTTNAQGQTVTGVPTYYMGSSWQLSQSGSTVAAVSMQRWAAQNPSGPYTNLGTMTVNTQYPTSLSQSLGYDFTNGFCTQIQSTDAANAIGAPAVAHCVTSAGTYSIQGYPGYSFGVTIASCGTACTGSYIQTTTSYPGEYVNGSTSVTAVNLNITQSWGGTTMPSSGTITIALVGVAARGGGVGMDQAVYSQVLGGIQSQAIPQYSSNGAVSAAPAGVLVQSVPVLIIQSNQTQFTPTGMSQIQARQQVVGSIAYAQVIPASDIITSQSTSVTVNGATCQKYAFVCMSVPFTYTGPTGKDIALSIAIIGEQQINNVLFNFVGNSGLTGATAACTSSTTTNMCMNATDITVGTPVYSYGAPVSWGGGGHASSTQPSWLSQKATNYPGWNTYAPLLTLQDASVVYGT